MNSVRGEHVDFLLNFVVHEVTTTFLSVKQSTDLTKLSSTFTLIPLSYKL